MEQNLLHNTRMLTILLIAWIISSIRVVNLNRRPVANSKSITAVGEHNFLTSLNRNLLKSHKVIHKDIHHSDLISKPNHQMETTGMECHCISWLFKLLVVFKCDLLEVPDLDGSIQTAGCY